MNAEDAPPTQNYSSIEIRCYFVRHRNALLVRGQFTDLFLDYYLHLADHGLKMKDDQDQTLKDGLVAMALHLASRPWNEYHAWNVHFENPVMNLFVCGDNVTSKLVGRAFHGDPRPDGQSLFLAQVQAKSMAEPRSSSVSLPVRGIFPAAEHFYMQSEQRIARHFEVGDEDFVFITAQPQCDLEWLEQLTKEQVLELDKQEELSLLETRKYHFECGCNAKKICEVLIPHVREGMENLFGSDEILVVGCRRCGADYRIQREQLEAFLVARDND